MYGAGGGYGLGNGMAQLQAERQIAERERLAQIERQRLNNELERSRLQRLQVQQEAARRWVPVIF